MKIAPTILFVEDDAHHVQVVKDFLKDDFRLICARNCLEAKEALDQEQFCLYIVDICLDEESENGGLEVCRLIRNKDKEAPIIISSAKAGVNYKVMSYKLGINNYLCKPYSLIELKAIIEAQLRLNGQDLAIDPSKRVAKRAGKVINLRKTEFEILRVLFEKKGEVVSREKILQAAYNHEKILNLNTIDVHIKNLRDAIDKPFNSKVLKTIYGVGYKLDL